MSPVDSSTDEVDDFHLPDERVKYVYMSDDRQNNIP